MNLCASYFAIAQFSGETFEEVDGKIRMTRISRSSDGGRPGYDLPLGREVAFEEFYNLRKERDVYALPPLTTTLEIEEVDSGFNLHVKSEGYDRVPFQIACDFVPGGELDFDSGIIRGQAAEVAFLKSGYATYHIGNDAISVGPGAYTHSLLGIAGQRVRPHSLPRIDDIYNASGSPAGNQMRNVVSRRGEACLVVCQISLLPKSTGRLLKTCRRDEQLLSLRQGFSRHAKHNASNPVSEKYVTNILPLSHTLRILRVLSALRG